MAVQPVEPGAGMPEQLDTAWDLSLTATRNLVARCPDLGQARIGLGEQPMAPAGAGLHRLKRQDLRPGALPNEPD
jgi:hypothetical protein